MKLPILLLLIPFGMPPRQSGTIVERTQLQMSPALIEKLSTADSLGPLAKVLPVVNRELPNKLGVLPESERRRAAAQLFSARFSLAYTSFYVRIQKTSIVLDGLERAMLELPNEDQRAQIPTLKTLARAGKPNFKQLQKAVDDLIAKAFLHRAARSAQEDAAIRAGQCLAELAILDHYAADSALRSELAAAMVAPQSELGQLARRMADGPSPLPEIAQTQFEAIAKLKPASKAMAKALQTAIRAYGDWK